MDAAKESGVESINQVQPAVVKKDQAKAEIDNAAQLRKQKSIETQMRQTKKSSSKSESR